MMLDSVIDETQSGFRQKDTKISVRLDNLDYPEMMNSNDSSCFQTLIQQSVVSSFNLWTNLVSVIISLHQSKLFTQTVTAVINWWCYIHRFNLHGGRRRGCSASLHLFLLVFYQTCKIRWCKRISVTGRELITASWRHRSDLDKWRWSLSCCSEQFLQSFQILPEY